MIPITNVFQFRVHLGERKIHPDFPVLSFVSFTETEIKMWFRIYTLVSESRDTCRFVGGLPFLILFPFVIYVLIVKGSRISPQGGPTDWS